MERALLETIAAGMRGDVLPAEPLRRHTTYEVGGAAEVLVRPASAADAAWVYRFAKRRRIPLTIIGAGSNVIAPDGGVDGIVIATKQSSPGAVFSGDGLVRASAGTLLSDLARAAADRGLGGLEAIACIPGTVGGAIAMNAGTRDGDAAGAVRRIGACTSSGRERTFNASELCFGYRRSIILGSDWLVLWAEFALRPADPGLLRESIDRQWEERRRTYPLDAPSAGSVFKRPPGDYPGRLIEACGCKGLRRGGAVVSDRHANFIVNTGHATAEDILALIGQVRAAVYEKTGIYLELEQIPLGVHASCRGHGSST